MKIYDDDRNTIAHIANADVAVEELGEVALAVARAGTTRLLAEDNPATAIAG